MVDKDDKSSQDTDRLEKPIKLDQRAVAAKNSEPEEKSLLEDFMPFLNARVARYTAHLGVSYSDDALSISMLALHEAVSKYDITKGHFFPFADRVVRARIIDHIRKVSKQDNNTISLSEDDDYENSPGASMINIASLRNYDEQQRRARLVDEIEQFKSELTSWGITMDALTKSSPKHKALRKTYNELLSAVMASPDIMQTINIKRYFPINAISKNTGLPQKKLERARIYILAALIIKAGDYELISEFIDERGAGKQ